MIGEGDRARVERPSFRAPPVALVKTSGGAKHVPVCCRHKGPRRRKVARRVAQRGQLEIDHRRQPAIAHEEVGRVKIAIGDGGGFAYTIE